MNRQFLEFWGNFLLQAAQGQKRLEDLADLSRRGFSNLGDLTALFRQVYGLKPQDQGTPDYLKVWKKAEADFRTSFEEFLRLLGVVPQEEYRKLAKKCEELEAQVAEQEETIRQLRLLLSEKGLDFAAVTLGFKKLLNKQSDQFQELLKGMGELVKGEHEQD